MNAKSFCNTSEKMVNPLKDLRSFFFLHLESLKQSALQFNVCHPGGGGQSQNAGNHDVLLYLSLFISRFLL